MSIQKRKNMFLINDAIDDNMDLVHSDKSKSRQANHMQQLFSLFTIYVAIKHANIIPINYHNSDNLIAISKLTCNRKCNNRNNDSNRTNHCSLK